MLGWGEMPNNWDLMARQVNTKDPSDSCLVSARSSCPGSLGPRDAKDSHGRETMQLGGRTSSYLVYVRNSCGIPYSTVAASHITITDGVSTKKTYLDVPHYNRETFWLIGCIRLISLNSMPSDRSCSGFPGPATSIMN